MKLIDLAEMKPGDTIRQDFVIVHRDVNNTKTNKPVFKISAHRLQPLLTGSCKAFTPEGALKQAHWYLGGCRVRVGGRRI